jgi:ankyrin repeat protein
MTPVHWAAFSGQATVLSFLIDNGGKPLAVQTGLPLLLATRYGRNECVNILLAAGAPVSSTDITGRTPLHLASWFGHADIARALVDHGADVEATDAQLRTPLHCCCWFGSPDLVSLLLEKHAPPNAADRAQDTPLHLACRHKRVEIVRALLNARADPKAKNAAGETAEDIAEAGADRQILEILEKREVAVQPSTNDDGRLMPLISQFQEMTKTIEVISAVQMTQTKTLTEIRNVLETEWTTLQKLTVKYSTLTEEIGALEETAVMIRDGLKAGAQSRFSLRRTPK